MEAPGYAKDLAERLAQFEARASDDAVKTDLELTCTTCGEHLCDIEHGDEMVVLVGVMLDHTCVDDVDDRACIAAGEHQRATRHRWQECTVYHEGETR